MNYSWLLFDADGTLFDFDKAERSALQKTFEQAERAFEPAFLAVYAEINRRLWSDFEDGMVTAERLKIKRFEQLAAEVGLRAAPETLSAWYLAHLAQNAELIEGAVEVVERLSKNARLLLITNGLKDVQRPRVAKSALRSYFEDLVISEEVGSAKPDRVIFDHAFQRMGNPPKREVLIIGDSLSSDIRGGLNYGIDTCWFNPAGRQAPPSLSARFEIQRLEQLPDIVESG